LISAYKENIIKKNENKKETINFGDRDASKLKHEADT